MSLSKYYLLKMKFGWPLNSMKKKPVLENYYCHVCGSTDYSYANVLWDSLVSEWQLSPEEVEYINLQQGITCVQCGANMRSIALSKALLDCLETDASCITDHFAINHSSDSALKVLEINEAGGLSPFLKNFPNHKLIKYPKNDMHDLSKYLGQYDIVIHSDTLEHVRNPIHALNQCKLALKGNGSLIYTVPVIPSRLSRDRSGLPNSTHSRETRSDYIVATEFGADFWSYPIKAGFQTVKIFTLAFPVAVSLRVTA